MARYTEPYDPLPNLFDPWTSYTSEQLSPAILYNRNDWEKDRKVDRVIDIRKRWMSRSRWLQNQGKEVMQSRYISTMSSWGSIRSSSNHQNAPRQSCVTDWSTVWLSTRHTAGVDALVTSERVSCTPWRGSTRMQCGSWALHQSGILLSTAAHRAPRPHPPIYARSSVMGRD